METNESKAQLEVWEWKELVSEELNKIPKGKKISYITEKTKLLAASLNMEVAKLQPLIR